MGDGTRIEWTDATWPVVQGCDYESPGCTHCYATHDIWRMAHNPNAAIAGPLAGLVEKRGDAPTWTGKIALREDRLQWPLRWSKPRRIFVSSHGDLFHPDVPDAFIDRVFAVMAMAPQHVFQVLTKRAGRMRDYLATMETYWQSDIGRFGQRWGNAAVDITSSPCAAGIVEDADFPLPNVWMGVSVEDQRRADERVARLLATPATLRFVSLEPLLGAMDLAWALSRSMPVISSGFLQRGYFSPGGETLRPLDWVICGGESGAKARPMQAAWARSVRDQCIEAGVPYFFKQWGEWIDADQWLGMISSTVIYDLHPPLNYTDAATLARKSGLRFEHQSDGITVIRVGKKAAGALIDGHKWQQMPGDVT